MDVKIILDLLLEINMRKVLGVAALVSVSMIASGCSYVLPRKIPVLGIAEGSKGCAEKKSVYYYRDADVGVCIPEVMAVYTHCVSELTMASTSSKFSETGGLSSSEVLDKLKGLNLTAAQTSDLAKAFSDTGSIGIARGKAIDQCYVLVANVYRDLKLDPPTPAKEVKDPSLPGGNINNMNRIIKPSLL